MTDISLNRSGPPETVLAAEDPSQTEALAAAVAAPAPERHDAISAVVATDPGHLAAWAALGDNARDTVEAYAAYRVGYHRGLDRLRQSGWRGSGFVRWEHQTNRGFLAALDGLSRTAAQLGEVDEAERCAMFLRQLDPAWPPS